MENVPQVIGKKNISDFNLWRDFLESLGYKNYYKLLNAKDFGIPQNRNRCFMISLLGDYYYEFPSGVKLNLKLKDMLDENVEGKYYLTDNTIKTFEKHRIRHLERGNGFGWNPTCGNTIAHTIKTTAGSRPDDNYIIQLPHGSNKGSIKKRETLPTITTSAFEHNNLIMQPILCGGIGDKNFGKQYRQGNRVYDSNGIAMALMSNPVGNAGGNSYLYKVYEEPIICAMRGRNPENPKSREKGIETKQMIEIKDDGTSNALTTVQKDNLVIEPMIYDDYNARFRKDQSTIGTITSNIGTSALGNSYKIIESLCNHYRIRKLTPRECFRLMGFSDTDFYKASQVNSNAQLYKQAGNSIVVNVLMAIFKQFFE